MIRTVRTVGFQMALVAAALVGVSVFESMASAQQWAAKMFSETHHDFGTVSRNAKAEYTFEFVNPYDEEMRVVSARSSCGCTKALIQKNTIKPHEKGEIVAQFNTKSFIGHKQAMVTLVFDRPYYAEVQLTVSGTIRSDVVTDPGEVRFGDVDLGQSREVRLHISYAGRPDWKITDVRGTCDHLEVRMDPPVRQNSAVQYVLKVRLKGDAPVGEVVDELVVVTNDSRSGQFVLPVSGRVLAPVTVTPKLVSLGDIKEGAVVKQKVLVRATKPFAILEVQCPDTRFQFQIPKDEKTIHVLPFEFQGVKGSGEFRQPILIKTSLGEAISADCVISGEVH